MLIECEINGKKNICDEFSRYWMKEYSYIYLDLMYHYFQYLLEIFINIFITFLLLF